MTEKERAGRTMHMAAIQHGDEAIGDRQDHPAPTAVLAPTHGWNSTVRVSSHHLARALSRCGWRVLFLATPVSPWHALLRRSDVAVLEKLVASREGVLDQGRGLFSYVPTTLWPHTYKWPFDQPYSLANWQRFTWPNIKATIRKAGFEQPDLLIVDNVVMAWLLEALSPKRSVYRITDHYASFSTTTDAMREAERAFAPRVDLVVYTANSLQAYAESLTPRRSLCLDHAVDAAFFENADLTLPEAYREIPKPRAVFVGVIGEWFDVNAVNVMAERMPEVSFVIVGPDQGPGRDLADLPNLHRLGPKPHAEVPALLHHADLGLIPFDRAGKADLVDGINPLKLYEYLIAGLPVVTTAWPELERLEAPVLACHSPEDFVSAIQRVLKGEGPDRACREAFARKADWQTRIGELLAALDLDQA